MEQGEQAYRRYLDGDESAFAEILELYRDPLTFFICRMVQDLCAAEDIAADVFMQLVVHPRRYHFKYSLKTYLFMLARSRSLDYLRKRKRERERSIPLEDAEEWLAEEQSLEEQYLQDERAKALHAAIAKLPSDQQQAVHLVYFEDRSYEDAARIMRKTRKQVDNLLYRAKNELRGLLGKEAGFQ